MSRRLRIGMGATFAALSCPVVAQAQGAATVQAATAEEALLKARQDRLLAAAAAVKTAASGQAELKAANNAAEAQVIWRVMLRKAAEAVAEDVNSTAQGTVSSDEGCPVSERATGTLVIAGATPPDVSQWLAFQESARRLNGQLERVNNEWEDAKPKPTDRHFLFAPLPALAIATTILPLFKTDYAIEGSTLAPADQEFRVMLEAAGLTIDTTDLVIPDAPKFVTDKLAELSVARLTAQRHLADFEKLYGAKDANDPPEALRAANTALRALTVQYDTFEQALFTPVNGMLPAVAVERQRRIWCARKAQKLLYVFSIRGNLTSITKKNLFSGLGSTPTKFRLAITVDYAIAGEKVTLHQVQLKSEPISFDKVGTPGFVTVAWPRAR